MNDTKINMYQLFQKRHMCSSTLKHYFQHATFDINNSFDQFLSPNLWFPNIIPWFITRQALWFGVLVGEKGLRQSLHLQSTPSNPGSVICCFDWYEFFFFKSFRDDRDSYKHTLPVWCSWASCTKTFLSRETTSMNWVHRMTFSAHSCVISVVAVCRRSSSFSKFYNTVKILNHTRVLLILNLIFNFVERKKFNLGWMRPSGFTNTWIIIFSFHHSFLFHT